MNQAKATLIVIGGGPAGSVAALSAARRGLSTILIEKHQTMPFKIGESLLPGSMRILESLGALAAIENGGFMKKYAARFVSPDKVVNQRYDFQGKLLKDHSSAFHVERSRFDELLLNEAEKAGVLLRRGSAVKSVEDRGQHMIVQLESGEIIQSDFIIDASGQSSFLAKKYASKTPDTRLRLAANYVHATGVEANDQQHPGDINITLLRDAWWWEIPLAPGKMSLGLVSSAKQAKHFRSESSLRQAIADTPFLRDRYANAVFSTAPYTTSGYAFSVERLYGDKWLIAGDAAGFLDPVFSTGVHLAIASGNRAGNAIADATVSTQRSRIFRKYEKQCFADLHIFRKLVYGFYTEEFVDVFLAPTEKLGLRKGITSLLAGELLDSSSVKLRAAIFWLAVYGHRKRGIVQKQDLPTLAALYSLNDAV